MSQVDDWSDGYTSDYLRDLNTYGPASANVPRPSSVVSRRVQYQPPVAQTEAKTNDTPLYSGGREDLWNIRSGQDSGWQGRAGQGSDWGSSGRSSSSRSRSQSGESGTGRSSGRSSGRGTSGSMGRSSGRSTNSRVGRSASSGTGSRSTISGADVTADVMKALKADGNTSFADWRSSLKRQGFANADSIKYDPTTGKFIDTTGGSMPSAPTGTYKDTSDPLSQRILANSTTDNSGAGSGRVAESVVGAAQDITDQASPYRAVAALAGADNVGSPGAGSAGVPETDFNRGLMGGVGRQVESMRAPDSEQPAQSVLAGPDAASGIPPEIMARLKKDADDGSPWGLLPWALGPTYTPIAGLLPAGQKIAGLLPAGQKLLPAGQKLLPAGQKLLPYNGEAAAGAVGSKAGEAAAGDAAAGAGSKSSFRFDLSPEEIASAKASHDAYVRGTAGAADGGVSELANAGNVGRETAAGAATGAAGTAGSGAGRVDLERAYLDALNNVRGTTTGRAATGAAGTAGSGAIDSTTRFLIKQIKTGKLDNLERAWIDALADRGARNPQLLSASEQALLNEARAAGILGRDAAGAARGAPQGTVAGAGSKARWDEIPDANGMTRSRADEVLARGEIRRYDPRTTREGIARYIEDDLKTLAGKPGYETPYQAFQTLMSQWGKYNPDLGQDPYNYIWRLAVRMFE